MSELDHIQIAGAREHNLKNVTVEIPKKKLVVFTGVSGSGKSSLAFDTLFAEGQRRYVESLSAYARQFLGQMDKPRYDHIRGLAPTVSIEQKAASKNPRSTVGTITEINDYLRVLFARVGEQHCHLCGKRVTGQTPERIADDIETLPDGTRFLLLAPVLVNRKGEHREIFERATGDGFARARVNGEVVDCDNPPELDKRRKHSIELVIDRLVAGREARTRLVESVEAAVQVGGGECVVALADAAKPKPVDDEEAAPKKKKGRAKAKHRGSGQPGDRRYSTERACTDCAVSFPELSPQTFSFNSPLGACPSCNGLGAGSDFDPDLLVPDKSLTILEGAVLPWKRRAESHGRRHYLFRFLHDGYGVELDVPWCDLPRATQRLILYGSREEREMVYRGKKSTWRGKRSFEGVIPQMKRRMKESRSERARWWYRSFLSDAPCSECQGERLRPESRAVRIADHTMGDVNELTIAGAHEFFTTLELEGNRAAIAEELVKEIGNRLRFLLDVGLSYLTLSRQGPTLSGGESQRIRLASQVGSELTGVIYVLDEPSIGLHQRDNTRLLATLQRMRDIGNTVVVVEHDEETMREADWVVDFGIGAGRKGGDIVYSGSYDGLLVHEHSLTGQYLSGRRTIDVPEVRREPGDARIRLTGASANNLKSVDIEIPIGLFTCVTGVSGAGKSSLFNQTLYPALARHLHESDVEVGPHREISGLDAVDKVINIDQKPIGRTPRSNPATYTKVFDEIRDLFTILPESKRRGYKPGRFSFNVRGGRCERCEGAGLLQIEMHFLADVYVPCEECHGRRFNEQTLQVRYKGKSIADVLDMPCDEALELFDGHPKITHILQTLVDVGLGYISVGQPSPTLSGGEAQRIKLARELARKATGRTIYFLDEPTTGLHFEDIQHLLVVLDRLVESGNTVVVIEHNLDVIKTADWILDLGPEGGDAGGQLVASGAPETVAKAKKSHTGRYLKPLVGTKARKTRIAPANLVEEEEPEPLPKKKGKKKAATKKTSTKAKKKASKKSTGKKKAGRKKKQVPAAAEA